MEKIQKRFWHFYISVQIDQSEHSMLINYAQILLKFELDLSIPIIHIQTKFHQNWTIFTQVIVWKPNCGRTDGRSPYHNTSRQNFWRAYKKRISSLLWSYISLTFQDAKFIFAYVVQIANRKKKRKKKPFRTKHRKTLNKCCYKSHGSKKYRCGFSDRPTTLPLIQYIEAVSS